jgi:hypothetical protein
MLTHIDYLSWPDLGLSADYAYLSVSDLLSLAKTNIKRLSAKGILKSGLYSYLFDLIKKDIIITDSDV